MKLHVAYSGALTVVCLVGFGQPVEATEVTEEEFKALKDLVIQQGRRLDQLEQAHQSDLKTIDQNKKVHEQDQQEIQMLKLQIQDTPEAQ